MESSKTVTNNADETIGIVNYIKLQLKNTHMNVLLGTVIRLKNDPEEYDFDEKNIEMLTELKDKLQYALAKGEITRKKMNISKSQEMVITTMFRSDQVVFMYNLIQTVLNEKVITEVTKAACISEAGMHVAKMLDDFVKEQNKTNI